jgi:hypothetical protein
VTTATELEIVRLQAKAGANLADALVWRWYADMMEDERLACIKVQRDWVIMIDGNPVASNPSFDCAMRIAREASASIGQHRPRPLRKRARRKEPATAGTCG